jgi:recombination protein RecA
MPLPKAAVDVMKDIRKKYGEHSISTASTIPNFDVVQSGSLCLDYITGIGGLPSNRVIEYAGEPGSGKSTLAMHTMNNALKMWPDRAAVFFDLEQKVTVDWMTNFIDDMDRVLILNPDHIEQATDMFKDFVKTGDVSVVVLDSIGGAPTRRTTEKSSEIANFGGNAMGVGDFARHAATLGGKYRCLTVCINQIRQDMQGYRRFMTPGGEALKHACSLRVQTKRGPDKYIEKKANGEEVQVGYDVILKIVKSGVGTPYRATKYRFYSEQSKSGAFGVDRLDEIMRLARLSEVIGKRGGWYYHEELPDGKINGEAALLDFAGEMPEFADTIEAQIRAKIAKGEAIAGASVSFDEEYAEQDDNGFLARKLNVDVDAEGPDGTA